MPRATPNALESEPTAEGALASANGSAAPVECEEAVIQKIRLRRNAGRKKYGTTMERTDLNRLQWLQHAQEEAMDLAIYLERLMREERQNDQIQTP